MLQIDPYDPELIISCKIDCDQVTVEYGKIMKYLYEIYKVVHNTYHAERATQKQNIIQI